MLFYACATAVLALLAVLAASGQLRSLYPMFKSHWRLTLIAGSLNPALYYVVLFAAYDRLPAQVAQPINYTWAIVLTLLSVVILKQKITIRDVLAAVICYGGVFVIATQGDLEHFAGVDLWGIGFAIVSTVIWASYWIINIRDTRDVTTGLCLNFLVALLIIGIACAIFSSFIVSPEGLVGSIYVGLIEMAFPFLLWSHALKLSVNTARVSNLIFLAPFVSLVLIHHVVGESIVPTTFVGLL
jgi:drug/metabolite transporter (DMT)-like permease